MSEGRASDDTRPVLYFCVTVPSLEAVIGGYFVERFATDSLARLDARREEEAMKEMGGIQLGKSCLPLPMKKNGGRGSSLLHFFNTMSEPCSNALTNKCII